MSDYQPDTIVARATAAGRGGVGVVRISGSKSESIAKAFLGFTPKTRHAHFSNFYDSSGTKIDEGIALFFNSPYSFTGEDIFEIQCHGGSIIIDMLIKESVKLGARLAKPGEFSERAFLNDKLDLAQAEAIADLIDSSSEQAARSALRSLQGEFSREINNLVEQLTHLRIFVEAAIDFPDEEIDFISDGKVRNDLVRIINQLLKVKDRAKQGSLLRDGMNVVIAGRPNAGKSSLMNALSGRESAIVTDVEGTTRDLLREQIILDGMPLHITDTAGLRESSDQVERIGIDRAWAEIKRADRILIMTDARNSNSVDPRELLPELTQQLDSLKHITLIRNKIDLTDERPSIAQIDGYTVLNLSAKEQVGVDLLSEHLKTIMGFSGDSEGAYMARRRHIDAIEKAETLLYSGLHQLDGTSAGELLAEDLRQSQVVLGTITGQVTADDLLGKIFGSFCIGK